MSDVKVISFMRFGKAAAAVSLLAIIVSIGSLFVNGLNFGLDFTCGTSI